MKEPPLSSPKNALPEWTAKYSLAQIGAAAGLVSAFGLVTAIAQCFGDEYSTAGLIVSVLSLGAAAKMWSIFFRLKKARSSSYVE